MCKYPLNLVNILEKGWQHVKKCFLSGIASSSSCSCTFFFTLEARTSLAQGEKGALLKK